MNQATRICLLNINASQIRLQTLRAVDSEVLVNSREFCAMLIYCLAHFMNKICSNIPRYDFYLCWAAKVMRWFVDLFVSIGRTDFHEISRICRIWCKRQSGTYGDVPFKSLGTGLLYLFFLIHDDPCLLAQLWKNGDTHLYDIFRKGRPWDQEQAVAFSRSFR